MFENSLDLSPIRELADWRVAVYLAVAVLILWVAKLANQATAGYSMKEQLTDRDNKAVAVSFAGFILSLCLIIHGILTAPIGLNVAIDQDQAWLTDLTNTVIWSAFGCALLLITRVINDKVIFPRFSNKKELVTDRNVGMGAAQAGSYLATALIIRSVLSDEESGSLAAEFGSALVWFIIAQVLLLLFSLFYQKTIRFNLHDELEKDNAAAGVAFSGNLIAFSLLLTFYLDSYDSLAGLAIWSLISALLLLVIRLIIGRLILSGSCLNTEIERDQNWGAALIETATVLGVALLIEGAFY